MGIIQFFILLVFILLYVVIAGSLIVRFAARGSEYYRRGSKRNGEVPLGG